MARSANVDKDQVLKAALLVFWRQGYEATPIIDLAAAMRLNRVGLYKAFGSKHELFILALRYYQQELHGQLLEISADAKATVLVRVRRVLKLTVNIPTVRSLPKGCFMLKAGSELLPQDSEVQVVVDESQKFLESLLVTLLREGQRVGEVRTSASPRAQARFVASVLTGLHVTRQLHPKSVLLDDTIGLTLIALAK
jgi:TetR/AcrR family transcriptional repressor of nem operon